jgi:hypoxanthine phosphoribosyltransferase
MAKSKAAPKTDKATKTTKVKGPVPNYTKKVKPVEAKPILPPVKLVYCGISTALIAHIYDKKNMSGVSHVDDQLCWQAATAFACDFNRDMNELDQPSYIGLANFARKLFVSTAETVKNITNNYMLDAFEVESFGAVMTKGIFKKRKRFWHYVDLAVRDRVPANLGFYFEDTLWSDVYNRAKAFDELVKEFAEVAKAFVQQGYDPEMNMCISKGALCAPSGLMSEMTEDQKIQYQALKFWAIDGKPAMVQPTMNQLIPVQPLTETQKLAAVIFIADVNKRNADSREWMPKTDKVELKHWTKQESRFEHVQPPLEGEMEITLTETFPK